MRLESLTASAADKADVGALRAELELTARTEALSALRAEVKKLEGAAAEMESKVAEAAIQATVEAELQRLRDSVR